MKRTLAVLLTTAAVVAACTLPVDAKPPKCKGWRAAEAGCGATTTQPATSTTATTTQPTTTTTSTTTTTVPTGSDETPLVQAALDATGSFTVDRAYRIDSPLVPPAGSTITFTAGGKFVRTDALGYGIRKWPVVDLRHGGITILDPVIEGPNTGRYSYTRDGQTYLYAHEGTGLGGVDPNMEESGAFVFNGGSGYHIRNPRISSVWGDGFTFNGATSDVLIENPTVEYVGRSIISNVGSSDVTIIGGSGHGAFWWGINLETIGANSVARFDVQGLTLGWNRYHQVFASGTYFNCQLSDIDLDLTFSTFWDGTRIADCVSAEVVIR